MSKRGFSIVELAIVIAVIGILSLLLFANLRSNQISARDDERHAKAALIAKSLELLYKSGNKTHSFQAGSYPSIETISNAKTGDYLSELLPSIEDSTLRFSWTKSGSSTDTALKTIISSGASSSNNNTELTSFIEANVDQDEYVYEPLEITSTKAPSDNNFWRFCMTAANDCRRFNLYYRTEADNLLHTIRSTNQ